VTFNAGLSRFVRPANLRVIALDAVQAGIAGRELAPTPRAHSGPAQTASKSEGEIKGPFGYARAMLSGIMPDTPTVTLETILVVDDNVTLLNAVVEILRHAKFQVLSATDGADAIELAGETKGRIDLLLSDVDMPPMSGPDLGLTLKKTRPDLHVMLMSGGANGNLLVLNYGWAFIQKPFVATKLVQMIIEVLHSPDRSQPGGQEFDTRKDTRRKADQFSGKAHA
jgi:CheY-like chemotaxis protein